MKSESDYSPSYADLIVSDWQQKTFAQFLQFDERVEGIVKLLAKSFHFSSDDIRKAVLVFAKPRPGGLGGVIGWKTVAKLTEECLVSAALANSRPVDIAWGLLNMIRRGEKNIP